MKTLQCTIPTSLYEALDQRSVMEQTTRGSIISEALSRHLDKPIHTLFQVSTSAALVEGLYQGAVRVSRLLQHGDFGLGTFVDLEGEMVVLDGVCYQVSSDGGVRKADSDTLIPYAVVTRFARENSLECQELASLQQVITGCDDLRKSQNLFYAFRIDGTFAYVKTRVMKPVQSGVGLKAAANAQEEFVFEETEGTLVGLWSPGYAKSFSVPGYHFHFLSKDRHHGGHVLACGTRAARIDCCEISDLHVSLPETEEFLRADLTHDPNSDLTSAEENHSS